MQRRAAVEKPSRNLLAPINSAVHASFQFIPGKKCFKDDDDDDDDEEEEEEEEEEEDDEDDDDDSKRI
nr:unnamed protein product [Spirometra erinaceieuropaei]